MNSRNFWTIWMSMIKSYQLSGFSFQLTAITALVSNLCFGMPKGTSGSKRWTRTIFSLFLFSVFFSTAAIAQTPNFDQLKNRFDSGEVFAAEFSHVYTDSYTGEVTASDGSIWIDKVRYKLQSEGQTIVVDGETSTVYDPSKNRVIVDYYDPEDDDFAPSRMLSGIDSTYTVSEEASGDQTIITLESTDDFAVFARVEIVIDDQLRPTKITAWDISDNEIETVFSGGTFMEPTPGLFEIEYPEDAEVVDMRY